MRNELYQILVNKHQLDFKNIRTFYVRSMETLAVAWEKDDYCIGYVSPKIMYRGDLKPCRIHGRRADLSIE